MITYQIELSRTLPITGQDAELDLLVDWESKIIEVTAWDAAGAEIPLSAEQVAEIKADREIAEEIDDWFISRAERYYERD